MEDFIEYILVLLVVMVLGFTLLLLFLLVKHPFAGYALLGGGALGIGGIVGWLGWKWYRRRRLGAYYETFQELVALEREVFRTIKRLDPPLRRVMRGHVSTIRSLCRTAQGCLVKLSDLERALRVVEQKQGQEKGKVEERNLDREGSYSPALQALTDSRRRYLRVSHQVLQFLQDLHAKLLVFQYAHGQEAEALQHQLADTIEDLFVDIEAIEEVR
ncbi:hypothetical protein GF339_23575 [candidate division KSB3 bacterium]|uniref:Uncharacterized protein n=1 Tax=candidate division KSB3 bacterium TaxID=2044937 RepID=A0A9D5Q854_9BACT|nr:hypothetical protein [candidate division KSB3 bacterium]MBD3327584.1 hypothetical protein [candidate division KSB3 bacterium]